MTKAQDRDSPDRGNVNQAYVVYTAILLGWVLVLGNLNGCATSDSGGVTAKAQSGNPAMGQAEAQSIRHPMTFEAAVTTIRYGKPPLAYLTVDIVLRNDRSEPRWFLIPTHIPRTPGPPSSGVYAMDVFAIDGTQERGVIGELHGIENGYALLVSSDGEVHLKGLQINYWQPDNREANHRAAAVELMARSAKEILIGNEPIRQWFGVDPLNRNGLRANLETKELVTQRRNQGYQEVPLTLIDEEIVSVKVPYKLPP